MSRGVREGKQSGMSEGRSQVLELLRKGAASVNDLAAELEVTPNAVRAHLSTLGSEGLVEPHGQRRGSRRPEVLYRLTESGEEIFPKAYALLLEQTLDTLRGTLDDAAYARIIDRIGQELALRVSHRNGRRVGNRLTPEEAVDVLVSIGGQGKLEEVDGDTLFRGTSCPLSAVAPHQPDVCRIASALLSELTGTSVTDECERGDRARCVFRFAAR